VVRYFDRLFRSELLWRHSLAQMLELVFLPEDPSESSSAQDPPPRRGKPGYGLGVMGDSASPWGLAVGHNGGGPCYNASAFHAFDLGGASVCVMGAIEDFDAEGTVFDIFDRLADASDTFR
jgi:D-alanyl-D-alanine carboxypeptidase